MDLIYQAYRSPYDKTVIKDTDYLVISARVKAMETKMLSMDRLNRLLEAEDADDAIKLLTDAGYPPFDPKDPEAMDHALGSVRESVFKDLEDTVPDPRYLEIFRIRYDYHNLKTLLKAAVTGSDPDPLLENLGRVPVKTLKDALTGGDMSFLPQGFAEAAAEGREILETTSDPQLSDAALDRLMFREQLDTAAATGSKFLTGYVKALIDAANLKAAVRSIRMGKNADFLAGVLAEGGEVSPESILSCVRNQGQGLAELYAPTLFRDAAQAGASALGGGPLTGFEKLTDDAVCGYLSGALYVAFGEAPLVGFLAATETEITNLRIILMGKNAGLDPEIIRQRLRTPYVR